MQRKRYAPGRDGASGTRPTPLAVLAAGLGIAAGLGLTGCSAGGTAEDVALDAKAGSGTTPVVAPGRYRTLFEPCGAVPQATLQSLLPATAALTEPERAEILRGTHAATYDTDRRVGCTWSADFGGEAQRLVLDVERVVSYDPAVSDAARAQELFTGKQLAAKIPLPPAERPDGAAGTTAATPPPGTPSGPASHPAPPPGSDAASHAPAHGPSAPVSPSASAGAPSASATTGLEPRQLSGLGDVAFLDDVPGTASGNGHQRVVSVVFRTSNVLVTVEYLGRTTGVETPPDSKELQDRAQNLARLLADRLEE
ncbi:DUF3558 domain-containing protein [Streptomyces termitum]|uniref:DUF3558 domain-containing protein n=1 Tax=Streptomyces termitum TaxID=67368 RepID=UPI0037B14294